MVNQETKEEIKKKIGDKWKWKPNCPKPLGYNKTVLIGKFITIQAYIKKQEKFQIRLFTLYLKELEREEQIKAKFSQKNEIIKIRAEINNTETKTKNPTSPHPLLNNRTDQWNQELVLWKNKKYW